MGVGRRNLCLGGTGKKRSGWEWEKRSGWEYRKVIWVGVARRDLWAGVRGKDLGGSRKRRPLSRWEWGEETWVRVKVGVKELGGSGKKRSGYKRSRSGCEWGEEIWVMARAR